VGTLEARVDFQRFLADLSATLIGLPPGEVGARIDDALRLVGEHLKVDNAAVLEFDDARSTLRLRHRWTAEPAGAEPFSFEHEVSFPSYTKRMLGGEPLVIASLARLAEMPGARGMPEVEYALRQGWRSAIEMPLAVGGSVIGVLGVCTIREERSWTPAMVQDLRLVADVIANALKRERDMAAQGRAEAQVARLRRELAHAARLASMGELAGALAHELNQPLTAIQTNARTMQRMLGRDATSPSELAEILEDIAADAVRAGEIIRRLRDWLAKGELRKVPLDVNEVLRGIEPFARADTLENDVRLVMDLAPGLPGAAGDPIQLQQTVLNLVRNASEAMRSVPAARREVVVRTGRHGPQAILVAVEDAGPALPEAVFAKLFDPFFTTKPSGLGLGLSISRSIVEAHGGRLWATRNPDHGITVQLTIPAGDGEGAG
jgi:two-component system sensor kinase FixL